MSKQPKWEKRYSLTELRKENALLTAQVAMQFEALEIASDCLSQHCNMNMNSASLIKIEAALSATAETVADWKRENGA